MRWKTMDKNNKKTVHHIEKIDNFDNLGCPILRFRSSLRGPCKGMAFANFIMDIEHRKHWDAQIEQVYKLLPMDNDLDKATNLVGNGTYGSCTKLGVGYCQTKKNLVVTSREQLTLCGVNEISDNGATIIWGKELDDKYNYMFPSEKRHTRARSHLFSVALVPTSFDTFDVEYTLQLDSGGKIPTWMTTPVIAETVKSLFQYAENYYQDLPQRGLDASIFA